MSYWTAQSILTQVAGELGLPRPLTIVGLTDVQSIQLLSLLNSAGNELLMYYPWEQFSKEWVLSTTPNVESYDTPADYGYLVGQTQWDRTNHWPLLGPKTAQEWAWLKGSTVAQFPRLRFRVQGNKIKLFPVPGVGSAYTLAMEYVSNYWVETVTNVVVSTTNFVTLDGDVVKYDPWLVVKFIKFKFYELKGFPTSGVSADFMRVFNSLIGKDTSAPILSLSGSQVTQFIGSGSIPDGSWNV